jgi:hypothetical protein
VCDFASSRKRGHRHIVGLSADFQPGPVASVDIISPARQRNCDEVTVAGRVEQVKPTSMVTGAREIIRSVRWWSEGRGVCVPLRWTVHAPSTNDANSLIVK